MQCRPFFEIHSDENYHLPVKSRSCELSVLYRNFEYGLISIEMKTYPFLLSHVPVQGKNSRLSLNPYQASTACFFINYPKRYLCMTGSICNLFLLSKFYFSTCINLLLFKNIMIMKTNSLILAFFLLSFTYDFG